MKTILLLGTLDSKGKEFDYLYSELIRRHVNVRTMNVGIFEPTNSFSIDIHADDVARAAGESIEALRERNDRGHAMRIMSQGARILAQKLQQENEIDGIISMGGGGGTSIATTAMQGLPLGFPKICITTLASGDTHEYVGTKDIVLYPSIVDISGINRFSRMIISRAAGAICGMTLDDPLPDENDKPIICISMFGNSTEGVEKCAKLLEEKGYATMIFHATGGGGRSMEEFIKSGGCVACLDVTTTEWADEYCGGILSAGPDRLDGPSIAGIPHVICPGCLDMVNFGTWQSVPEKYKTKERVFYEWNPMVTLMRTTKDENRALGKILAEKANKSNAPVAFILPEKGLSILDGENQVFCDWDADEALFKAIEENVHEGITVERVAANVNDQAFADAAVSLLLKIIKN